jgi:hypothetical protein
MSFTLVCITHSADLNDEIPRKGDIRFSARFFLHRTICRRTPENQKIIEKNIQSSSAGRNTDDNYCYIVWRELFEGQFNELGRPVFRSFKLPD